MQEFKDSKLLLMIANVTECDEGRMPLMSLLPSLAQGMLHSLSKELPC